jgi:hypothetical protein
MKNFVHALLGTVILLFTATRANAQQCCTGNVSTYCTAGTSVLGCLPSISGTGVPSADATSGFLIQVGSVPAQRQGLVFYGFYAANQAWAPFSPSYLCVAPPVQRTGAMSSGGVFGQCNGRLEVDFNAWRAANPTALGYPFAPGQTIRAQGWYRDPAAPAQTNLSDALAFALCAGTGDTTPPVISACAPNQTVGTSISCQGVVPDFRSLVSSTDACAPLDVSQSPQPGTLVGLGVHGVYIQVRDPSGNSASCQIQLTIVDSSAPIIVNFPSTTVLQATGSCTAIAPDLRPTVQAIDSCGAQLALIQTPAPGSALQVGRHKIQITVSDNANNQASCIVDCLVVGALSCYSPIGMAQIPAGIFSMGMIGVAEPVHSVTISQPFWMSETEVTQARYLSVMGFDAYNFFVGPDLPVDNIRWFESMQYCNALDAQQRALGMVPPGYQYRLATEAEWEYCCRAGTSTPWNTGSSISCSESPICSLASVASYPPNAWGLYDMHGNVREWCLDSDHAYSSAPQVDPYRGGGFTHALRGGGFASGPSSSMSSFREFEGDGLTPGSPHIRGIRVVLGPILVP